MADSPAAEGDGGFVPHYTVSGTISLIPFPPRDSRSRRALGLTAILSYYNDEEDRGGGRKRSKRERERKEKKKSRVYLAREPGSGLTKEGEERREGRINETLNACATRRHGYGMPRLKRLTAKF